MAVGLLIGVDGDMVGVDVADNAVAWAELIGADWVEGIKVSLGMLLVVDEVGQMRSKRANLLASMVADELGREGLLLVGAALLVCLRHDQTTVDIPAHIIDEITRLRPVQDVAPL